jgi:hypothetical protein
MSNLPTVGWTFLSVILGMVCDLRRLRGKVSFERQFSHSSCWRSGPRRVTSETGSDGLSVITQTCLAEEPHIEVLRL